MSDLLEAVVQALKVQAAKNRGFLSDAMAVALARAALETIHHHRAGATRASGTSEDASEATWSPTGEVRWFTEHVDQPVRLQQAFRCLQDGQETWEDVPLAIGAQGS